ncbi:epoxide hydrolase 4-like [Ischnura elegans]|uniref:epoxide hydrolase 4-like n=1 Tax=Ischnura elegans TaxID=197161 RepID=UPI001ED8B9C9|nr:epoxide hydrolase 4-like [Ischnura elegans]
MGMQMKAHEKCIEIVSIWSRIKIYFFSILFGAVVIFDRLSRWALRPKTFFALQQRDKPPHFLVDNSLGQHSYVKLNGVKLHYVESGPKNKPLILMLHGFPDCWISWRHQIAPLSSHFRVVALDLKGYGDSDKPMQRRGYRVPVLLKELRDFITALGASSCVIIGHDIGALLGWLLAYSYPGLVKKFVAISCPHPNIYWEVLPHGVQFGKRWVYFSQLPGLPEIDVLREDLTDITQCYAHEKSNGDGKMNALEAYKYSFSRREDWSGPINYFRNLLYVRVRLTPLPGKVEESWDDESWKGGQVLLITGGEDKRASLESIVRSTEFLPPEARAMVRVVAGAKHFPHQEFPDQVNNYLLDFLHVQCSPEKEKVQCSNGEGLHKRLVNRVLESSWVSSTVRYGNQVLDAAKKGTVGIGHDDSSLSRISNGYIHTGKA